MREFEIRAWDTIAETWVYVRNIDFVNQTISVGDIKSPVVRHCSFRNESTDRFLIQQYTGIRDINDWKIWEGNIIKVWDNGNGVVKFADGAFVLDFGPNDGSLLTSKVWPLSTWNSDTYTVIGNIRKNPELVGVKP